MSLRVLSLPVDQIGIKSIKSPPNPVRSSLGDIDSLCRSIEQVGLLQPIIVREQSGHFEVVAGQRRLNACRRLRWRTVPCHVVELSDKEAFEVALTENIQRATMDPMEEAAAFRAYVQEAGWGGLSELSRRIGKSPSYVSKRMRLLSLPPEVLQRIFRRRKTVTIGEELLTLETSEQLEIARTLEQSPLSTREVRRLVKTIRDARRPLEVGGPFLPSRVKEVQTEEDKLVVRCIDQTISALKLALLRMDEVLQKMEKRWVEKEILSQYRTTLHGQIDSLLRLRKKLVAVMEERT